VIWPSTRSRPTRRHGTYGLFLAMWPSLHDVPCYAAAGHSTLFADAFPFPAASTPPGVETSVPSAARLVCATTASASCLASWRPTPPPPGSSAPRSASMRSCRRASRRQPRSPSPTSRSAGSSSIPPLTAPSKPPASGPSPSTESGSPATWWCGLASCSVGRDLAALLCKKRRSRLGYAGPRSIVWAEAQKLFWRVIIAAF
jgi:hypothetical protein